MKRRWILWLLVIGFIWLVVARLTEIEGLLKTLAQGQWQWILAAVILQMLYWVAYTGVYRAAFATVNVEARIRDLLPVAFASIFVTVIAPSGGASGAALFVDDAARRGQPPARAAVGTLLQLISSYGAFTMILLVGMGYLFVQHDLKIYEIISALVLMAATMGLTGVLFLGLRQPLRLRQLLVGIQRAVNRMAGWFRRPALLTNDWTEKNAAEFVEAAQAITARPTRLGLTIAVALAAHLVDLTSMYVLFRAFQYPITVGPLVAGYAMATLFLIVSPTPMGMGVVEGVTPLVLVSLGVPAAVAAVVVLAFRGIGFWLPLGMGFVVLQRVNTFSAEKQTQARVWNVRVAALLTALMGVINILSAVTPSLANRMAWLEQVSPLLVQRGGHLTAALSGFALLFLAVGLWRHKQTAWLMTMLVLMISVISHLVKGLDYEEAILAAALASWLFYLRPHFHAQSDLPSIRRGILILAAALVLTLAYGALGFYLLDRQFSVNFGWGAALRQTIVMFTQFYNPGLEPVTGFGRYFAASIYAVGAVTLGYGLLMLIRPVLLHRPATPAERSRAQAIVQAHGHSALARMTLFDDKAYWFSPGGSVVAYTAKGRAAVALGDPIGPAEDAAAAISGFRGYCARNDWQPAFYQTLPDYLEHYRAAGFKTLCVGNEGLVDLASFTTAGGQHKNFRSTLNRLTKLGHRAEVHQPPLPNVLVEELREVSDEWLTMMHGREKRFSLGWFDDDYIRNEPVMAIYTPEGPISAFTNLVPEFQRNEITADLMRRRPNIDGGTMEFLFLSLIEWAKIQGYDSFNMGLSPLSGVGERPDDPAAERALHYIYEHVNQFYSFKGLHGFKEKFHPHWSPRYFIYPGPASLPAVAMALNRASTGDDFVVDYLQDFFKKQFRSKEKE